jgi:hypothetical protein
MLMIINSYIEGQGVAPLFLPVTKTNFYTTIILAGGDTIRRYTTEEFIRLSKKAHGDKYNYDDTIYINRRLKVCIMCPNHGEFYQRPDVHYKGKDCRKCAFERTRLTKENFIIRSQSIHNNKFNYNKVKYINNTTKVLIGCPEHGDFLQEPGSHLEKRGCPQCSKSNKSTRLDFIVKSIEIHGNMYDYSKVVYINSKIKVLIGCSNHGDFLQTPNMHLQENGCPKCYSSKGERRIRKYLIKHHIKFEEQKKFEECKNVRQLVFDFYIPKLNACIEFQGQQHYESVKLWGGEEGFKRRQINDQIKRDYCKKEKIKLLEIPYWDL